jgi:GDP-D-mannose 3', 5'-epimerase
MKNIVVTGAAGFIGHHLVNYLKEKGDWVRGVDWKAPEYPTRADDFKVLDLRFPESAVYALSGKNRIDEIYALAADMGGMGFIQDPKNQYLILKNNLLINLNTVDAAKEQGVGKYLFSSSACVYPNGKQTEEKVTPLKESDAVPAEPQDTYGWEKLVTEFLVKASDMDSRIVRFHNIYGPEGSWKGGREKAPAALSRKIAEAKLKGLDYIEIWGDGKQTRTFCYIKDCLKGLELIMAGSNKDPVNLGRDELVSMNELADIISDIAGVKLEYRHIEGNVGVRGRNSDNTLFQKTYGWTPEIDLKEGLTYTYNWIKEQVKKEDALKSAHHTFPGKHG